MVEHRENRRASSPEYSDCDERLRTNKRAGHLPSECSLEHACATLPRVLARLECPFDSATGCADDASKAGATRWGPTVISVTCLGGNTQEATAYYNRVLEIDPSVYEAWVGKGKAAGWQSTLANFRLNEMVVSFSNAIGAAPPEEQSNVADAVVHEANRIVVALYSLARKHLNDFPAVDGIWPAYIQQVALWEI